MWVCLHAIGQNELMRRSNVWNSPSADLEGRKLAGINVWEGPKDRLTSSSDWRVVHQCICEKRSNWCGYRCISQTKPKCKYKQGMIQENVLKYLPFEKCKRRLHQAKTGRHWRQHLCTPFLFLLLFLFFLQSALFSCVNYMNQSGSVPVVFASASVFVTNNHYKC